MTRPRHEELRLLRNGDASTHRSLVGCREARSIVLLCVLFIFRATAAQAQGEDDHCGFRLRASLGADHVAALVEGRDDLDTSEVGLVGGLGMSWSLSERVHLGLGLEQHRLFEGSPEEGQPAPKPLYGVLGTSVLFAELEWRFGRFYLRPGAGFSYHSFGGERVGTDSRLVFGGVSGELGPAGGLAAGGQLGRSGPFTFRAEALLRWTGGEDSSSTRRLLAVTMGAALRP